MDDSRGTDPRDFNALIGGLNALVDGPVLIDEPALASSGVPVLAYLNQRPNPTPEIRRWINWSLLVRAAGLGNLVPCDDTPLDTHRHTSHLFAVYPGRQITPLQTPGLAEAARVSLIGRSDSGNAGEWSFAWRTSLYARLYDGDAAHRQIRGFIGFTYPNLFGGAPMQIDGILGVSAGIAEMLLQSHAGGLDRLPALPKAWPSGSVSGLRARGGVEVDLAWRDGRLEKATFHSLQPITINVRYHDRTITLKLLPHQTQTLGAELQ